MNNKKVGKESNKKVGKESKDYASGKIVYLKQKVNPKEVIDISPYAWNLLLGIIEEIMVRQRETEKAISLMGVNKSKLRKIMKHINLQREESGEYTIIKTLKQLKDEKLPIPKVFGNKGRKI